MWRFMGSMSAVCLMGCVSCGSPIMLTHAGAQVRLGNTASANCRELGVVNGENGNNSTGSIRLIGAASDELAAAENDLRNRTAALGGNAVIVGPSMGGRGSVTVRGHALKCPDLPDIELPRVVPHAKAPPFSPPPKSWPDM